MIFYGAGGHAKVVIDAWLTSGNKIAAIFDDNPKISNLSGWSVSGPYKPGLHLHDPLVISIGDNERRRIIANKISGRTFGTVVHPAAALSESSSIGAGSVVMAGVVVNHSASTGLHCILNTGCIVEHDCLLGDFVHVAPNATLCGGVTVGEGTLIGVGAVVVPGVSIGKWSVIGAGAVVLSDIPDNTRAAGNPAKVIGQ